eukprot:753072-Rhodomonas_salina.1
MRRRVRELERTVEEGEEKERESEQKVGDGVLCWCVRCGARVKCWDELGCGALVCLCVCGAEKGYADMPALCGV